MTSASADGVPEPAARRLDPAVVRAAHRAGALGGGMLWTGVAATYAASSLSIASLSMAASIGAPEPGAVGPTQVALLGAWLATGPGASLAAIALLGLVLAVAGVFASARMLAGAGVPRPTATTMLGSVLAALLGTAAAAIVTAIAPIGWHVGFGGYGGADAAQAAQVALQILPQMLGGVVSGVAILAVACTAAGILTWRLAARILSPRA
ncbi:hypothetical protein OVA14_03350 [Agrococcus sp. SL85]|uniref:hypothetical protein n=1 Tax=Agrococcus sp. SL85 TaxID=2995141 RepID=UPI00226CF681|nr:hypothetical protein [Agrococcus sp. SL85]WAC66818.1 hypothetical protein OVA14_03350 [Agrococcus sp. SL85]